MVTAQLYGLGGRSRPCGRRTRRGRDSRSTWVAHDAGCAAIARALETAARRRNKLDHLTIFADAQAAILRMTSDEPGPGQRYAVAAREHIAELRRKEPEIRIEIQWCPSHCGVEGNEKAGEWAKQAVDEPEARGVEWHRYMDRCGRKSAPTCSLAHIKRKCSEAKWTDASKWVKAQLARTSNSKSRTRPWLERTSSSLRGSTNSRRTLPHGTIAAGDHEKARRQVLVV